MINVVLETGPVLDSSFMVVTKPRREKKNKPHSGREPKREPQKAKI